LFGKGGATLRGHADQDRSFFDLVLVGVADVLFPESQSAQYSAQIASRSTQSGPLQRCQQWTCCQPSHRWDQESAANCSQHWSDKDTLEDLGFELGSRFLHSSFMSEQYADILRWKLCIQQILYCSRCGLFVP